MQRRSRQLQAKGFDDFLQLESDTKALQSKRIYQHVNNINTHIKLLKDMGNLINCQKINTDPVKSDFAYSVYRSKEGK